MKAEGAQTQREREGQIKCRASPNGSLIWPGVGRNGGMKSLHRNTEEPIESARGTPPQVGVTAGEHGTN